VYLENICTWEKSSLGCPAPTGQHGKLFPQVCFTVLSYSGIHRPSCCQRDLATTYSGRRTWNCPSDAGYIGKIYCIMEVPSRFQRKSWKAKYCMTGLVPLKIASWKGSIWSCKVTCKLQWMLVMLGMWKTASNDWSQPKRRSCGLQLSRPS
jgi:hypothetical protein